MIDKYYILGGPEGHTPIPVNDIFMWGEWFETAERHVGLTIVEGITISTVFLGLDHNWGEGEPILFETMLFSDVKTSFDYQERYETWDEAALGHAKVVELVKRFIDDEKPKELKDVTSS